MDETTRSEDDGTGAGAGDGTVSPGDDWLAGRFEAERTRLRGVAYRMLGDTAEADDAVQETWLRLHRTGVDGIDNVGGWLTTVVSRVCLDVLRARRARPPAEWEDLDAAGAEPVGGADGYVAPGPEDEAVQADAVGAALQVVLGTLAPPERLAFVLHDLFGVPFDEIAPIVGRSSEATRQLASRARRRVRGSASDAGSDTSADAGPDADAVDAVGSAAASGAVDRARQREVVAAFLAASREGRFEDLLAVLDPDVVLRADATAVQAATANASKGAPPLAPEVHGAFAVASALVGRAQGAQLALVDGSAGAVWAPHGKVRMVFAFTVRDGRVAELAMLLDRATVEAFDVELLDV